MSDASSPKTAPPARRTRKAQRFCRPFTQQEPVPEAGITAAIELLRSGRLHRYNTLPGETSPAAVLERRFADWQGARHCLAVTSGGQAMQIALRALGVPSGAPVLTNAWTLAPVPGAIASVGALPILVETTEDLVIDLGDLDAKAKASGARVLLLSHMRGHLADMAALMDWAETTGIAVIEDCAHTMGATWNGRRAGGFGQIGCFSTQTYKHLNSGEGGLLVTDDPDLAARAIVLSGSYMLYDRHGAAPAPEAFDEARFDMPNGSARMDNLRAAILLPQLDELDRNVARWDVRHTIVAQALGRAPGVALPVSPAGAHRIGSSIQFRLPDLDASGCRALVAAAAEIGVEVKWFGASEPSGFTSSHASWRYLSAQTLPKTDRVLATLFDMRLPLTFSEADCHQLGSILHALVSRHV